jgi:sulfatase maturation enzyme AslB (radical SAM superfamily)
MLEKTFCSSPWFHVRLTYDGSYESCRWGKNLQRNHKFQNETIMQYYNSGQMKLLRQQLLNGETPEHCATCYYEESYGKINGRRRQLAKSAIDTNDFLNTLRSSPHYEKFEYSYHNDGEANLAPVDLQIELGNICNSACIMCGPEASSKLERDYKKLFKINSTLFQNPNTPALWVNDPDLVDRFVNELIQIPNIRYIHFLGGETLYVDAFYTICEKLIQFDLAKNIIIGTTTNGTIFDKRIKNLIRHFKEFHLGISIESITNLNDYIRYPGKIDRILKNIKKFLGLRKNNPGLYTSLRITPNIFTVYEIDKLFEFMIENHVIAESCNILYRPKHLRMELLPEEIRNEIKQKIEKIINKYELNKTNIVNIRRSDMIDQVTANTILDYYKFICSYEIPDDIEESRHNLISFLKAFETIRKNSILDYAPRYEKFLRHYGY